ncbi:retinol dehydrogenase 12-like [Oppia nitens]|uniref:retinol dehydrogenase 12-like n=1 Tax=Oppia nitens TaxID=1686743 RepID=UPI0023DA561C|nr:retinol dehydrogenase 12-like [Oppia nitens]
MAVNTTEILSIAVKSIYELSQNFIGWRYECKSNKQLDGQLVVITGANTGIGKETARDLAKRGAKIIIGCRDESRANEAINDIKREIPLADIMAIKLDLSSLKSIRKFAETLANNYQSIAILINNAGVVMEEHKLTDDGFEMTFGTNHLGHFLLTLLLLPLLQKAPKARVVNVSSYLYTVGTINFDDINGLNNPYNGTVAYCNSKLANNLFTWELAKRLGPDSTVTTYAVHPGGVRTDIHRNRTSNIQRKLIGLFGLIFCINAKSGAQTSIYCAVDERLDNETGGYYEEYKCTSNRRLTEQVVVITGANTGIGKETARDLAKRGAKVIIGCRDEWKAADAIKEIKAMNPKADITALKLDLSSLKSVREFAQQLTDKYQAIDVLINNAGVTMNKCMETKDGFEMTLGINHLGHFLLTMLLLPLLRKSPKARVVNVSSFAHVFGDIDFDDINSYRKSYVPFDRYAQSKLANILFTRELARRLGTDSSINTYAVHPGIVRTAISRSDFLINTIFMYLYENKWLKSAELGAQTSLYCAIDKAVDNETGFYYENCNRNDNLFAKAKDDETAHRLWELSAQLVKLEDQYNLPKNPN